MKQEYEQYLNKEHEKKAISHGVKKIRKYGTWLKRNDPMAFQRGYERWQITDAAHGRRAI